MDSLHYSKFVIPPHSSALYYSCVSLSFNFPLLLVDSLECEKVWSPTKLFDNNGDRAD